MRAGQWLRGAAWLAICLPVMLLQAAPASAQDAGPRAAAASVPGAGPLSPILRRAIDALELGDREVARAALTALLDGDPTDTAGLYLLARLDAQGGRWEEAMARYHLLLTSDEPRPGRDWSRLIAARWVRARAERDAARVRSALLRETPPPPVAGRWLVPPLEPLLVAEETPQARADAAALGAAAAEWLIRALNPPGDPLLPSLQEALLLRRGQVAFSGAAPESPDSGVPPVSTVEGIAHRLAFLEPAGPPPWAPAAERPARYLSAQHGAGAAREIADAVAHFQGEQGLAPTGVVDAETRRLLERAFREARARRTLRARLLPGDDPQLVAARLTGAELTLAGTIEPLAEGGWRWEAAWIAAADGTVRGQPVSGTLSRRLFGESWARMIAAVAGALPAGPPPGRPLLPEEEIPACEGAIHYGRALLALHAGETEAAAGLFALADRAGAGTAAGWFAQAWGLEGDAQAGLEARLLEEALRGPRGVGGDRLRLAGGLLAGDLLSGIGSARAPAIEQRAGLSALPDRGWLRVSGRLE